MNWNLQRASKTTLSQSFVYDMQLCTRSGCSKQKQKTKLFRKGILGPETMTLAMCFCYISRELHFKAKGSGNDITNYIWCYRKKSNTGWSQTKWPTKWLSPHNNKISTITIKPEIFFIVSTPACTSRLHDHHGHNV